MTDSKVVITAWLHEMYGGKIGYCFHEDGYKRCEVDAGLLVTALSDADFDVVKRHNGRQRDRGKVND